MTTREKVDKINKKILRLNENLGEIRSACKHTNTKETTSTYRIGASCPAIICKDCDYVIRTDWKIIAEDSNVDEARRDIRAELKTIKVWNFMTDASMTDKGIHFYITYSFYRELMKKYGEDATIKAFKAEGFTELELAYAQGRIKKEK